MPLEGKTILVTGGTGSFGRRFVETVISRFKIAKIIILSRDEHKQHEMQQLLPYDENTVPVRYFIGDVRDKERLRRAFVDVDIIVHAAALKQIPACEYNPFEAVKTNILGTQNVIDAAIDCGVGKVLTLSTDKSVNPINLYGATKLCAEKLVIQGNAYSKRDKTILSCARYGNIVGSRGSVVPLFLEQRKKGEVTLTDARMTRFWITLNQGIEFVIRCLDLMRGGEIFVPRAPSARLTDIVEAIAPGCKVRTIGIRPGEKLHEMLISNDEARNTVLMDGIFLIHSMFSENRWNADGDGSPVSDDFAFTSDANDQWLSVEQIRELVESD